MKLYSHFQDRVLFIIQAKSKPELFRSKRGSHIICFPAPVRNYSHSLLKKSTVQEASGKKRQGESVRVSAYDSHHDKIKPPPHSSLQTGEGSLFTSANGATALSKKYICMEIICMKIQVDFKHKQKFTISII